MCVYVCIYTYIYIYIYAFPTLAADAFLCVGRARSAATTTYIYIYMYTYIYTPSPPLCSCFFFNRSRTVRRYNFEDNVRKDLDPVKIGWLKCETCGDPVDTTEETTRTLTMRRMAGQAPLCEAHGGGFGNIKPGPNGCPQQ